jgi:hypothetical protein
MTGRIKSVQYAYAFVVSDREPEVARFFYRDDIINDHRLELFDLTRVLVPGLLVDFTPVLHEKGPRAIMVRLLGNTPGNLPKAQASGTSTGANGNGHPVSP